MALHVTLIESLSPVLFQIKNLQLFCVAPSFQYIENGGKTFDFEFPEYIKNNVPPRKVKSSLSGVIDDAKKIIRDTNEVIEKQKWYIKWSLVGAVIAGIIGFGTLIYGGYHLTVSTTDVINAARNRINSSKVQTAKVEKMEERMNKMEQKLSLFQKRTEKEKKDNSLLKKETGKNLKNAKN